jgi:uncharacterized protein DUF4149
MLLQTANFLVLLGLGVQVGTIVFFSFVLTPVLFGQLTREEAARAVRLGFPGYYGTGVAALAAALLGASAAGRGWPLVLVVAAALVLEVYAGAVLLGRISRARRAMIDQEKPDESDPAHIEWRRLHGLSVRLNLLALGLGLLALWLAAAPAPAG